MDNELIELYNSQRHKEALYSPNIRKQFPLTPIDLEQEQQVALAYQQAAYTLLECQNWYWQYLGLGSRADFEKIPNILPEQELKKIIAGFKEPLEQQRKAFYFPLLSVVAISSGESYAGGAVLHWMVEVRPATDKTTVEFIPQIGQDYKAEAFERLESEIHNLLKEQGWKPDFLDGAKTITAWLITYQFTDSCPKPIETLVKNQEIIRVLKQIKGPSFQLPFSIMLRNAYLGIYTPPSAVASGEVNKGKLVGVAGVDQKYLALIKSPEPLKISYFLVAQNSTPAKDKVDTKPEVSLEEASDLSTVFTQVKSPFSGEAFEKYVSETTKKETSLPEHAKDYKAWYDQLTEKISEPSSTAKAAVCLVRSPGEANTSANYLAQVIAQKYQANEQFPNLTPLPVCLNIHGMIESNDTDLGLYDAIDKFCASNINRFMLRNLLYGNSPRLALILYSTSSACSPVANTTWWKELFAVNQPGTRHFRLLISQHHEQLRHWVASLPRGEAHASHLAHKIIIEEGQGYYVMRDSDLN